MKLKKTQLGLFCFLVVINALGVAQRPSGFCYDLTTQTLRNGKYIQVKSTNAFDLKSKRAISLNTYPNRFYSLSNAYGELTIFNPSDSTIKKSSSGRLSSTGNMIYLFASEFLGDFGLNKQGFVLNHTAVEDGLLVTTWLPPVPLLPHYSTLKLVQSNGLPKYIELIDNDGRAVDKTFFTAFSQTASFPFPERIVQISFEGLDSTVTRLFIHHLPLESASCQQLMKFTLPNRD